MSEVSGPAADLLNAMDWDDILETLEAQKCVLFLGSGAYQLGAQDLDGAIQQWLGLPDPEHPHIRICNDDGFLLLRRKKHRRKVIAALHEFYSQSFPDTELAFAQLAQIPFNIIVSLTPDNLLARTFDNLGLDYDQDFYFRQRKAPANFTPPTTERPLLYNLLGNIEEPESLVLTHQDFFDYLDSVFKSNGMHGDLNLTLEQAERYIFVGLPYEKWYFQLLLRVLSLNSDRLKDVERLALKEFENPQLRELYTEEFKIEFVPTDIAAFLGRLHKECAKEDLLKKLPPASDIVDQQYSTDELRKRVADNKTEEAMQQLHLRLRQRPARTKDLLTQLTVLRNRYKFLRQRETRGTIDSRDLVVENAQIVEELLELITKSEAV